MDTQQYRPTGFRILPPVVKNLIIINVIFFLATITFSSKFGIDLNDYLGLHYFGSEKFHPYQLITYMFMHGGFMHIFFNMFALWMFGKVLEDVWGPKRFIVFYLICGIGSALIYSIVLYFRLNPTISEINSFINNPDMYKIQGFISTHKFQLNQYSGEIWNNFEQFKRDVSLLSINENNYQAMQGAVNFMSEYKEYFLNLPTVIGASGAIFGILIAFGMLFPNSLLFIIPIPIPIKAKWFVIIYGLIELYSAIANNPGDNVAHFAHIGGMLFGFLLVKFWNRKKII